MAIPPGRTGAVLGASRGVESRGAPDHDITRVLLTKQNHPDNIGELDGGE
jgi:hypothetical protein